MCALIHTRSRPTARASGRPHRSQCATAADLGHQPAAGGGVPSHRGGRRQHRTSLHADRALRAAGTRGSAAPRVSVQQLHAVVDVLRDGSTRLFEATGGGGDVQLLTDGRDIYARTAGGQFYNLLTAPSQPMLVVGDEKLLRELGGKVRARKSGKSSRGRRPAAE